MTVSPPDTDTLDRTLKLLADPPQRPNVHDGFLDLLESTQDTGVGRIQALWQSVAGSGAYDGMIRLSSQFEQRLPTVGGRQLRQFFDVPGRLQLLGGERVLDIGSGPGNITRRIAAALNPSGLLVGLDVSTAMLRRAAQAGHPDNVIYVRADASNPPFADDRFDAVSSSLCLQLLPDPFAALDSFRRVLRPGGRLALAAPGAAGGVTKQFYDLLQKVGQVRLFRRGELADALREHGFVDVVDTSTATMQIVDARKPE
jgi:arsenite methyltransferase